jgi:hypothetical protein
MATTSRSEESGMNGIIGALVIHTQMCECCSRGERCADGDRLHDAWFDHVTKSALSADEHAYVVAAAA